jgi:hypothetical protein
VLPPEQYKSIPSAEFVNRSFKGYSCPQFHQLPTAAIGLAAQKETGPDRDKPACLPQNRILAIGTIFARFLLDLS